MDGVVEVITGQERRRRWSVTEKLRIVAQTKEPGAGVRVVAATSPVNPQVGATRAVFAMRGFMGKKTRSQPAKWSGPCLPIPA